MHCNYIMDVNYFAYSFNAVRYILIYEMNMIQKF